MTGLFSLFMDSMFHIRIYVGVRELMLNRELLETDMGLLIIERFLSVHPHPKYKQRYWGRNYRLQSKSVNSETMKIFRILSLSLASAYEQFDYEAELGLARWVILRWLRTASIWFCSEVEVKERERLWHTVSMAKRTQMKWWMHFIVWPVSNYD